LVTTAAPPAAPAPNSAPLQLPTPAPVLFVKFLLPFFTLAKGRGCGLIFHFSFFFTLFIHNNFFDTFFTS
jgi:hypothetical protein